MAKVIRPNSVAKVALFEPETEEGKYKDPLMGCHIIDAAITNNRKKVKDESQTGTSVGAGYISVGNERSANPKFNAHPYMTGKVFFYTLGESDTPTAPFEAVLIIRPIKKVGDANIRLSLSAASVFTAERINGTTWGVDTGFNKDSTTPGSYDATGKTVAEICQVINDDTNWKADFKGNPAATIDALPAFSNYEFVDNGMIKGSYVGFFYATSTEAVSHNIYMNADSSTGIPSFSMIEKKKYQVTGLAGCKVGSMVLNMKHGAVTGFELNVKPLKKQEFADPATAYKAAPIPRGSSPFTTLNKKTRVWVNGQRELEIYELKLEVNQELFEDKSLEGDGPIAQDTMERMIKLESTLSLTIDEAGGHDTNKYLGMNDNDESVEVIIYHEATIMADEGKKIPYCFLIIIPFLSLVDCKAEGVNFERAGIKLSGEGMYSESRPPIAVYMVNKDMNKY